jgi:hypothetical protein
MRPLGSEYRVPRGRTQRYCRGALLLASLAAANLAACVIIPIPVDHTRGRVVDPKTAIEIGVTTREEIVSRVGEPDAVWEDERVLVYSWEHSNLLLIVGAGGPGGAVVGAGYVYRDRMLLIKFDDTDRVLRAEWVERPPGKPYGELLSEWAKGKTNANP